MRSTTPQKLAELQRNTSNIRNICILAHVDHGKTTLADTLVASNGIISQRMAGKLRYLDSREDEQLRGITMKSSAISLHFNKDEQEFLINLIDSPGHIDFSSEVSTAVRLCDGAVVLVDVVEGVCPQTHAVLRQAWLENIRPVLVLNKLDRLITELKMSPLEAHIHLQQILEQVNAITAELFATDVLEKTASRIKRPSESESTATSSNGEKVYDWSDGLEDTDDSSLYFSPDQGNVIFGSALDGWGFGIDHFAALYAAKLGVNAAVLKKTLWGDFYLEGKTKMVRKGAQAKAKKPLFVQFVLENLWSVYEAVIIRRDKDRIEKIVSSLKLKIPPRDARHNDYRVHLQAICSQWLPLSKAVLGMVSEQLPSPLDMSAERVERLLCSRSRRFDSLPHHTQKLKDDFLACSSGEDAPVIVFVSKMIAMDKSSLPQNRPRPLTQTEIAERREMARQKHAEKMAALEPTAEEKSDESKDDAAATSSASVKVLNKQNMEEATASNCDQVFIAFARVFSGTVKRGQKLLVLGPKYDPAKASEIEDIAEEGLTVRDLANNKHVTACTVEQLYLFMGRELEILPEIPAGNVLGIGGLEDHVLKSATIASTMACPAFSDMYFEAAPIVRVAVEPRHAGDMSALLTGMKLLNQADACVEIMVSPTGEHILIAAGEVHLQKCVDDLRQSFAKVEINVSKAIVPFRETIILPPKIDMVNEAILDQSKPLKKKRDEESCKLKRREEEVEEEEKREDEVIEEGLVEMRTLNQKCLLRIRALPLPLEVVKILQANGNLIKTFHKYFNELLAEKSDFKINVETITSLKEFYQLLDSAFQEAGDHWNGAVDRIWSFGPKKNGPNLLLNGIERYNRTNIWSCLEKGNDKNSEIWDNDNSVIHGFQMATLSGPLCEEPMMGLCFIVEDWKYLDQDANTSQVVGNEKDSTEEDKESNEDKDDEKKQDKKSQPEGSRKHYGPMSGQLMSTMRTCCRRAFQSQPQRLMWAMYTCDIQATAEVLGRMYAVLGKRHGRILGEDMREGSSIFNITAVLPVIESFGFAEEIRKRTSGLASPMLRFSHWEVIDLDPLWVPTTEEEIMHFGEKADFDNVARKYMNNVRRRKGLKVDEQIVEFGEKQRTLTRNK